MSQRIRVCLIGLAACLVLATIWALLAIPGTALAKPPQGKGGGSKPKSIPVCVQFDDFEGVPNPIFPEEFLLLPDGIQSDGLGAYCHSEKGILAVVSSGKGLHLGNGNLSPRAPRTFFLDLSNVIFLADGCTLPMLPTERFGTEFAEAGFADSGLLVVGLNDNLSEMEVGTICVDATVLRFSLGDQRWRLAWAPEYSTVSWG